MESQPNPPLTQRLKDESFWLRLPFMLLFFIAWKLTELVLFGVILVQLCVRLLTGSPQPELLKLGAQLTRYGYQIYRYLTFNSEYKPFPFSDWPQTDPVDANPYLPECGEVVDESDTPSRI